MHYYLNINGSAIGPMDMHQIFAYNVNADTSVSTDGTTWRPLYTYPELMVALRQHDGPNMGEDIANKKLLCGILAIVVGTLGVQYFILGKVWGGIWTIVLSIVTCGFWGVITLIQGILMLCMSEAEFKRKYVDNPATMPLF